MAITVQMRTDVANLYASLFNRAPDADGLGFWVGLLGSGQTMAQVAQTMFNTTPARVMYPSFLTNQEIIQKFYTFTLGRNLVTNPDDSGVAFWTAKLDAGQTQGSVIAQMVAAVTSFPATGDQAGLDSQSLLANKVAVGLNYAVVLGGNDAAVAASILTGVTKDVATVATANAAAAAIVNPPAAGLTLTLTTAADQGVKFVGASSADNFIATVGSDGLVTNGTTLGSGDNLDGGTGNDTLNIYVAGTNTVAQNNTSFLTKGIENVLVANYETSAFMTTVDMAGVSGATTVGYSGSGTNGHTTLSNVQNKVDVSMTNSNSDLTVTYLSAFAGAADTQNVALNNVGATTGSSNILNVAGAETFAITTTTNSTLSQLTSTTDKTVTMAGAGNLTITTALDSTVRTVDASAATGAVTVTLNNAAADMSVKGGAGNDVIITGTDLTTADTIDGGAGTADTIVIAEAADLVTGLKITNFEALRAVDTTSYDLSKLTGITAVDFRPAAPGTVGVTSAAAGTAFRVSAEATTVTAGLLNANLLANTTDTVNLSMSTFSTTTPTAVKITTALAIDGVETLNIDSTGAAVNTANSIATITQTTDTLSSIKVTGTSDFTLTSTGSRAFLTKIDAGTLAGALTLSTNGATLTAATTIIGGTGNDVITGRALKDNISTGAGNDSISSGNGGDTIDGGAGNDTITSGTGADVIVGGTGDDSITSGTGNDNISAGDGNDALAFALTVTAGVATTGLNSSDTLDGGAGTDTITFNGALTTAATLDLASTTDTTFIGVTNVEALVIDTTGGSTNTLTVNVGDIALGAFNNRMSFSAGKNATTGIALDASTVLGSTSQIDFTGATGLASSYTVGNGKDNVAFSTGNDTLSVITSQFLQATDTLSGGTGTDTFSLVNSATTDVTIAATQLAALSSFETWTVDSATAGLATAVSITLTEAVAVANADTTTNALTISRHTSDTGTFTVNASALTTRHVSLTGGNGNDVLTGGGGNDSINGGVGVDTIVGGAGDDVFTATTLSIGESYDGGTGNDILSISTTGQSLVGVTVTAVEAIRLVDAGTLNARADGLTGTVSFGHAASTDVGSVTLAIDLSSSTSFNLSNISAGLAGTSASTIAATYSNLGATALNVTLSGLNDTFAGNATADVINGGAGNDTITTGGTAADTVDGGSGNDTITMAVVGDVLSGGSGTDTLILTLNAGTVAQNVIDLSSTSDQVTLLNNAANAAAQLGFENVNLAANTVPFTVTAISTGSVIAGTSLADNITGGAGNDTITMGVTGAASSIDSIAAGAGTDTLIVTGTMTSGLIAVNTVDLSATGDQFVINTTEAVVQSGFENVDLSGLAPSSAGFTITAISTGSTITGTSLADSITGGLGNDIIATGAGGDTVDGGAANDSITGGTGADSLTGGAGNDTISGGITGANTINGGTGVDSMTGGAATVDTYQFLAGDSGLPSATNFDVITNYVSASDIIDFTAANITVVANVTTAASGVAAISAASLATFNAADTTFAQHIAAVEAAITKSSAAANAGTTPTAYTFASWVEGSNTMIFISDGVAGVGANDVLIQLTGLTTATVGLTAGNITSLS